MKKLILTADDFGLSRPVNRAVEEAHRRGVLTTSSLMVGAPAAADAVETARRLPELRVGLHLVLVDGRPISPLPEVPCLVDGGGEMVSDLFRAGMRYFSRPQARAQLEREIRAQLEAFRKTGLPLDHVNSHHHFHLHPTVSGLLLKLGGEYGIRAIRFPKEPFWRSWRASGHGFGRRWASSLILAPWLALLKNRLRGAGVHFNRFLFGLHDSGNMSLELVLRFLLRLPDGVTEIYFHPGALPPPGALPAEEILIRPEFRKALEKGAIQSISFADL